MLFKISSSFSNNSGDTQFYFISSAKGKKSDSNGKAI